MTNVLVSDFQILERQRVTEALEALPEGHTQRDSIEAAARAQFRVMTEFQNACIDEVLALLSNYAEKAEGTPGGAYIKQALLAGRTLKEPTPWNDEAEPCESNDTASHIPKD